MTAKLYFATRLRGFFGHLFSNKKLNATIVSQQTTYELNSKTHLLLARLARSRLFDLLGFVQIIKCIEKDCDVIGSFNRFLKTDKPYFIYVENSTALYHYRLKRNKGLGRRRVQKALNDPNLKALVFMSKACADTFEAICGKPHEECVKVQIYPYVPLNPMINIGLIHNRCHKKEVSLLYIAQGVRFISKGALEVLESFKKLRENGYDVRLTMVTSFNDIDQKLLEAIRNEDGVTILDFKLSYSQMQELYASSSILLHPTSDDSCPLTILEAMKSGLPVITTRLYAIPEMVEDGVNGFVTDPKFWYFDKNNLPNPAVWNNKNKTILSTKTSKVLIDFLVNKISFLVSERSELERMSVNSFNRSNTKPFGEEFITKQWNELFEEIRS